MKLIDAYKAIQSMNRDQSSSSYRGPLHKLSFRKLQLWGKRKKLVDDENPWIETAHSLSRTAKQRPSKTAKDSIEGLADTEAVFASL